jgi:hypothetical protein
MYKMPKFNKNYIFNFNGLYIFLLVMLTSNYEFINYIININLNYISLIILINIIGLYLFIKNIKFEINFSISYKS